MILTLSTSQVIDAEDVEVYLNDAIFKKFMELGNEINREILEIKGIRESK